MGQYLSRDKAAYNNTVWLPPEDDVFVLTGGVRHGAAGDLLFPFPRYPLPEPVKAQRCQSSIQSSSLAEYV